MPHKASVLHNNNFLFFESVWVVQKSLLNVLMVLIQILLFQYFRTVASTNMNDVSSRSHAIFTILFTQVSFLVTAWWSGDHSTCRASPEFES